MLNCIPRRSKEVFPSPACVCLPGPALASTCSPCRWAWAGASPSRISYHNIVVGSVADPGCLSRIPDPTFFHPGSELFHPGSWIPDPPQRIQYFNQKKLFISSRKYDSGCSSRIRIPDPDSDFLPIPDPRSRGQKGTGSRIPDPDPQHWLLGYKNWPSCERKRM